MHIIKTYRCVFIKHGQSTKFLFANVHEYTEFVLCLREKDRDCLVDQACLVMADAAEDCSVSAGVLVFFQTLRLPVLVAFFVRFFDANLL